jgi:hypothetical protein
MSWTLERDAEAAIKALIEPVVANLDPVPIVFGSLLDDDASCDREERSFPRVTIAAEPAAIPRHKGKIYEVIVAISSETYYGTGPDDDPKRTKLMTLYGLVREALDVCELTGTTGFSFIALTFEQGGSNENDGAISRMILPMTLRLNKE